MSDREWTEALVVAARGLLEALVEATTDVGAVGGLFFFSFFSLEYGSAAGCQLWRLPW